MLEYTSVYVCVCVGCVFCFNLSPQLITTKGHVLGLDQSMQTSMLCVLVCVCVCAFCCVQQCTACLNMQALFILLMSCSAGPLCTAVCTLHPMILLSHRITGKKPPCSAQDFTRLRLNLNGKAPPPKTEQSKRSPGNSPASTQGHVFTGRKRVK